MLSDARRELVARLSDADRVVEVGVGRRFELARALATDGVTVVTTDVADPGPALPAGIAFVRDDVTDPDPALYAGADAVYACNCPPELQRPARDAAHGIPAPFLFTTLGNDPAIVPVRRRHAAETGGPVFVAGGPGAQRL